MGLHLLNLSIKPFKIQIMKKVKTYQFKNKGRNKVSISWQELLPNPKEVKIWLAKQHVASGLRILIEFAFSLLYKDIFCQWAISIPLCHFIWKVERRKEYLREDSRQGGKRGKKTPKSPSTSLLQIHIPQLRWGRSAPKRCQCPAPPFQMLLLHANNLLPLF